MARHKLKRILKLLFSVKTLLYFIRTPKKALISHLVTIIKYPVLYYKTINVPGYLTLEVGVALYEAVLKTNHKSINIVEVGAYKGLSTIFLSEAAKRVDKKVKSFDWFIGLPTVDPILDSEYRTGVLVSSADEWESNVRKNGSREAVDLAIGDARETMLPILNNDGFALAFLDVDLYQTTHDLLIQLRSVAKGGEVIFIHDASSPGIKKAIGEFHSLWSQPIKEEYLPDNFTAKLTIPLL
jgi:hypothetical protein